MIRVGTIPERALKKFFDGSLGGLAATPDHVVCASLFVPPGGDGNVIGLPPKVQTDGQNCCFAG
jgi:hypothetical protein